MATFRKPNHWIITTADVGATIMSDILIPGTIRWTGATTATHNAVLKDLDGVVVWRSGGVDAAQATEESTVGCHYWNGLVVDTLESGTLDLYLE